MQCKIIEVTKRTEGESRAYIEGFKMGAEMALEHGEEMAEAAYRLMRDSHIAQFLSEDDHIADSSKMGEESEEIEET